jgi:hypothetical protein
MDKGSKKTESSSEINSEITFTKVSNPSRNLVGEANKFLLELEKNGAVVSPKLRNQFIVEYSKTGNIDEAWRNINGD